MADFASFGRTVRGEVLVQTMPVQVCSAIYILPRVPTVRYDAADDQGSNFAL
jgi:hypothetical protein